MAILPKTNEYGLFEVRFESIGGLGANLAGKMLAELGLKYLGLNVSSFSSYGSEKKGTPVKSFIRFAEPKTTIKVNSAVENPHILVIFHENLIKSLPVTLGCSEDTIIIVNSRKSPEELQELLQHPKGLIGSIDATGIAMAEKVKINGVILGAIAKAAPFIKLEFINKMFEEIVGAKYPDLLEANYRAISKGYNELNLKELKENKNFTCKPFVRSAPNLGYKNQIKGGLIPNPGNNINKDLSASRSGMMPVFHKEKCIHCGFCDTVCPDLCMVFKEENGQMFMKGIDYQYCKGCLKCVVICPKQALTEEVESNYKVNDITVKLFSDADKAQNHK